MIPKLSLIITTSKYEPDGASIGIGIGSMSFEFILICISIDWLHIRVTVYCDTLEFNGEERIQAYFIRRQRA